MLKTKKPELDLEKAIEELSEFGQEQPSKKGSLTRAVMDFFSSNPFERLRSEKKILKAVEVVRTYYPLIEKFNHGTEKEKKLATLAFDTIQKYNKQVEYRRHTSFTKRAAHFIFTKFGLEPAAKQRKITLPIHASFSTTNDPSSIFSKITKEEVIPATKLEQDMFKMKAIMLLREHFSCRIIDITSIHPQLQKTENNIVSFGQLLKLLPGEEIELTGQFKRISNDLKRSIPLMGTFRLEAKSHQTGYPHPKQRSGFALSESLLPTCPLRPENLPLFYEIHKKKEEAAIALLPKGGYNESAKKTLIYKKAAFASHRDEFIEMHRTLAQSFLSFHGEISEFQEIIDSFFLRAENALDPFLFISQAYETFNLTFIKEAKQYLYENHIFAPERKSKEKLIQAYVRFIEDKRTLFVNEKFILFLSSTFESSIITLFLQEMSEKALLAPPLLSHKDRTVQCVIFNQLSAFLTELESPPQSEHEAMHLMKQMLSDDIALFSDEPKELQVKLLNELEFYYLSRHKSKLNKLMQVIPK